MLLLRGRQMGNSLLKSQQSWFLFQSPALLQLETSEGGKESTASAEERYNSVIANPAHFCADSIELNQ